MIEYKNLNYQGNNLYNGSEDTGYSVVLWSTRGWKVLWPDGVLSEDFYNLNRARENCRIAFVEGGYIAQKGTAGAFKSEIGSRVA